MFLDVNCPMGCRNHDGSPTVELLKSGDGPPTTYRPRCEGVRSPADGGAWRTCPKPWLIGKLLDNPRTRHVVKLGETTWAVQHPLHEHADDLWTCPVTEFLADCEEPPDAPGLYEVEVVEEEVEGEGISPRPVLYFSRLTAEAVRVNDRKDPSMHEDEGQEPGGETAADPLADDGAAEAEAAGQEINPGGDEPAVDGGDDGNGGEQPPAEAPAEPGPGEDAPGEAPPAEDAPGEGAADAPPASEEPAGDGDGDGEGPGSE